MKNDFKLIISLLQNTRFKVTIIVLVLLGFMSFGYISPKMTFISGVYSVMTWDYFIMILLLLFLFNTYNIYTEFTKNYSFLIRMKDYKEFFNKVIKFIFISNLIIYLIVLIVIVLSSIINTGMNMKIDNYLFYNISNSIYLIFHLIRSYFILNVLVVFCVSIYKLIKEEIGMVITILIPILIIIKPTNIVATISAYLNIYILLDKFISIIDSITTKDDITSLNECIPSASKADDDPIIPKIVLKTIKNKFVAKLTSITLVVFIIPPYLAWYQSHPYSISTFRGTSNL